MPDFHGWILFLVAFVPLITGWIWYNPKVIGKPWMAVNGFTEEGLRGGNMWLIFGLTYLFGLFIAASLVAITIHQVHYFSVMEGDPTAKDPNSATGKMIADFFNTYGSNFRTFKHGALHGTLISLMLVMPVIATQAMFERRGWKYVAIHTGYWVLTLMIMGGLVCQFL